MKHFIKLSKKEAPRSIRLFKFGSNETTKGDFILTKESSLECLKAFDKYGNKLNIDYNHQQLSDMVTPEQGISAGTYDLEIRKDGLYAVNILWTSKAKEQILNREYLYISPAFLLNENNEIVEILNFALTNMPATLNMKQLQELNKDIKIMDEQILSVKEEAVEELACAPQDEKKLDMPMEEVPSEDVPVEGEPEVEVEDPMKECMSKIEELMARVAELESIIEQKTSKLEESEQNLSKLDDSLKKLDDDVNKLSEENAELKSELENKEREELLSSAIKNDKITPSQKSLFKTLSIKDLKEELEKLPKLGLLTKISDEAADDKQYKMPLVKKSIFSKR